MSQQIDAMLRGLLERERPVALVNFPNHHNPGDNAVWLGAQAALRRIGVPVGYASNWSGFSARAMQRAVGDGPLLLNGGGNFGDLYAGQQGLREHVLAHCTDRRVIQLPQSICFERPEGLERMRRLCASHPAFTLVVRERRSLELAQQYFDVPVLLAPDMAFGLGPLRETSPPQCELLWLGRRDREAVARTPPPPSLPARDWADGPLDDDLPPFAKRVLALNQSLVQAMRDDPDQADRCAALAASTFRRLGRAWLLRGIAILRSARVIITDRLHAHVLATQLGMPHVVLDNSYGKVRSTFETWTRASGLAHWAETTEEALDAAALLTRG